MTTCTKCGRPDTEGSRFCTFCGAALVATQLPATEISPPPAMNFQPPPVADRLIGQTIDGKYRIDARIGVGGMGTVYRATRLMIGDAVAVKIMHPEQSSALQASERFRREAQAAARLKHPNAVTIHDFGVSTSGMLYLVMELVEGESLRDIISRQGPLAPAVAAEILNQVAAALDEAHRHNIVHRDLKPDNIIVWATQQGLRVKTLDFGIAKLRDLRTSDNLTQTGALLGTPQYMSPEQCLGEELDGRSDIYSLGIVLFEMLTGAIPFNAPSAPAIILQQVQQPPPSPRVLNSSLSPAVEAVVLHALQKQREARPQTAGVLAKEMMFAVSNPELGQVAAQSPTAAHGARMTNPPSLADAAPPLAPTVQMGGMPGHGAPAGYPPFPAAGVPSYDVPAPNRKPLIIGLSAGAVALIGVLIAVYFLFFAAKASIMSEIKKGNLVKPEGSSAFDLYQKHKSSLSSSDVTEISNEVTPKLEARGNEIINNLRQETTNESEAGWAEAIRVYDWLNELRADKMYESRKYFSQARLDFLRKDYNRAIAGFRRASELDPSWAMAFNGLARAYLNAKDKYNAKDNYIRATNLDPQWIYPWINLGQLCLDLGDYAEAENALRQASNLDPQRASIHFLLGQLYEKTGNICAARTEYQTAINNAGNSLNPGFSVEALRRKLERLGCQYGF
jgi:serine/threonine-protein kinase